MRLGIFGLSLFFQLNTNCVVKYTGSDPNMVIIPQKNSGDPSTTITIIECTAILSYKIWRFYPLNSIRLGNMTEITQTFLYDFPFIGEYKVGINIDDEYPNTIVFDLPEGTDVYSMRNGIVVLTDSSNKYSYFDVCPQPVSEDCNEESIGSNYVVIRHDDGTLMWYDALKYGEVYVSPGQVITEKTLLGKSGKTGWTPNGPVLQLYLTTPYPFSPGWYNAEYTEYKSLLITFNDGSGYSISPTVGKNYTGGTSYPPTKENITSTFPKTTSPVTMLIGIICGIIAFLFL